MLEGDPGFGQPLQVRRARLGVAAETGDVVVQIVAKDEHDVGPWGGSSGVRREKAQTQGGVGEPGTETRIGGG